MFLIISSTTEAIANMPFIDSILFTNRSFSVISRYSTTYRNCLRMATDRPYSLGQRDTSRFPLKKVLREAPASAPCWPEERAERHPPRSHLEGSSSGKARGGMNNPGSCAIKVDLDSLRKCSVLLPEGTSPVSRGPGGRS